jgi:hypothetical protein
MEKEAAAPRFGVMQIVIIAVCAAVISVTAVLSSFVTFVPGISFFYIPLMLEQPFGGWFGVWGVIGSYLGGFLYQPFYGIPILYGAVIGLTDALPAVFGLIAFKMFKADPSLRKVKDWVIAVVFCYLINGPVVSILYNLTLVPLGWYTVEYAIGEGFLITMSVNWVVQAPQFIILLALSPFIKKTPLYIEGWY